MCPPSAVPCRQQPASRRIPDEDHSTTVLHFSTSQDHMPLLYVIDNVHKVFCESLPHAYFLNHESHPSPRGGLAQDACHAGCSAAFRIVSHGCIYRLSISYRPNANHHNACSGLGNAPSVRGNNTALAIQYTYKWSSTRQKARIHTTQVQASRKHERTTFPTTPVHGEHHVQHIQTPTRCKATRRSSSDLQRVH